MIFSSTWQISGGGQRRKACRSRKKNRNCRKSRENSRKLLEAFLRSRKEENLYAIPVGTSLLFPSEHNSFQNMAGPSKMPLRSWYNCGTNNFQQEDFCLIEMKKPTVLSNKCSKALSNRAIQKLNFLVSGRISVVMSTFSVFWLSYGRSGNEFCAEEGQNPIFDPLPRNEKLCGNLYRKFALRNGLPIS